MSLLYVVLYGTEYITGCGYPTTYARGGVASMVSVCDVVTIDPPLHPETEDRLNGTLIAKMSGRQSREYGARQDF